MPSFRPEDLRRPREATSSRSDEALRAPGLLEDVGPLDEAELGRPLYRLAAGGRTELAVRADGLGLHGVPRDLEVLGDLPEGQVRRQEREEPQLGRSQLLALLARVEALAELRGQLVGFRVQDAQVGPDSERRAHLCQNRGRAGRVCELHAQTRGLEPDLRREPREGKRSRLRREALGACQVVAGPDPVAVVERSAGARGVRQRALHGVVEVGVLKGVARLHGEVVGVVPAAVRTGEK